MQHGANVAVGLQVCLRHAVHQRRGRIIRDEVLRDLQRQMMRGVRIARQQVENLLTILDAAAVNPVAQHRLGIGIVQPLVKPELRRALRRANRPAGEALGYLEHVLLSIAGIDAQGMQFHQLAAVIFVEAAVLILLSLRLPLRPGIRARHARGESKAAATESTAHPAARLLLLLHALEGLRVHTLPIVEVKQHSGTLRRGLQQIAEFPHGVRANGVALVGSQQPAVLSLSGENIEVVEPEIGHLFVKLAFAVNGAIDLGHGELGDDALRSLQLFVIHHWIGWGIAGELAGPLPVAGKLPAPFSGTFAPLPPDAGMPGIFTALSSGALACPLPC